MKPINKKLTQKLRKIKLIGFDFDGVFTDGRVYVNQDGVETVVCSRRDSLGLNQLKRLGIKLAVISMEPNPIVEKRCEKLKIECVSDPGEKIDNFKKLMKREGIKPEQTAFMGDDLNDLDCLKHAGVAFTVADAADECKRAAHYVTSRKSGDHAVREICDLILKARSEKYEHIKK